MSPSEGRQVGEDLEQAQILLHEAAEATALVRVHAAQLAEQRAKVAPLDERLAVDEQRAVQVRLHDLEVQARREPVLEPEQEEAEQLQALGVLVVRAQRADLEVRCGRRQRLQVLEDL